MQFKKIILLIIATCTFVMVRGQDAINYQHRIIERSLKKNGVTLFTNLQELNSRQTKTNGRFFEVQTPTKAGKLRFVYIGRVNSCRAGGCERTQALSFDSSAEYFDYFIFFDKQARILGVKVYNYQATHGHEVSAKGWLRQFEGYDGSARLAVNRDIDAIAGATVSVNGITHDIQLQTQVLKQLLTDNPELSDTVKQVLE